MREVVSLSQNPVDLLVFHGGMLVVIDLIPFLYSSSVFGSIFPTLPTSTSQQIDIYPKRIHQVGPDTLRPGRLQ